MPKTETPISQLRFNELTKTQFKSASDLSETELYAVDPEFTGGKLLKTDSNGEIVESTATEEDVLAGASAIQGVQVNGSDLTPDANKKVNVQVPTKLDWYGTCETAGSTKEKTVICEGFVLTTGASIRVKFKNGQNFDGVPQLNVNSTGAIIVRYDGTHNAVRYEWVAGEVVSFTYDGTYWIINDGAHATVSSYGRTTLTDTIDTTTTKALTPNGVYLALQGKVDLDLNNMNPSATAKENIIKWGMPSDTFIDLSFAGTAVGKYEYTAPANGYLVINFTASTSGGSVILTSDSNTPSSTNILQQVSSSGHRGTIFYPMKKGKTVYLQVAVNSLYTLFNQRFYYAEGEV